MTCPSCHGKRCRICRMKGQVPKPTPHTEIGKGAWVDAEGRLIIKGAYVRNPLAEGFRCNGESRALDGSMLTKWSGPGAVGHLVRFQTEDSEWWASGSKPVKRKLTAVEKRIEGQYDPSFTPSLWE